MQYTISALVANKSGVLMRVSPLFSRRAYNIDSLSVCATEDPTLSRMTIVLNGDDYILEQMMKQMDKLIDVKKIIHVEAKTPFSASCSSSRSTRPPKSAPRFIRSVRFSAPKWTISIPRPWSSN